MLSRSGIAKFLHFLVVIRLPRVSSFTFPEVGLLYILVAFILVSEIEIYSEAICLVTNQKQQTNFKTEGKILAASLEIDRYISLSIFSPMFPYTKIDIFLHWKIY